MFLRDRPPVCRFLSISSCLLGSSSPHRLPSNGGFWVGKSSSTTDGVEMEKEDTRLSGEKDWFRGGLGRFCALKRFSFPPSPPRFVEEQLEGTPAFKKQTSRHVGATRHGLDFSGLSTSERVVVTNCGAYGWFFLLVLTLGTSSEVVPREQNMPAKHPILRTFRIF